MTPAGNSSVAAANATYLALFQEFFGRGIPGITNIIAQDVQVPGSSLKVPVATTFPLLEQWYGDKVFKTLRQYMFEIGIVSYEASLKLKRLIVDTDQTGTIEQQMRSFMGSQVPQMDRLVVSKLLANPTGYDGVALGSNSHPHSSSTGDNLTADALSLGAVRAMDIQMRGFKSEDGEPWDVTPNVLLVGHSNQDVALEIAGADRPIYFDNTGASAAAGVVGGVVIDNVTTGKYSVVVSPRLGAQWFLIDTTKAGLRPIVTGTHRSLEHYMEIGRASCRERV